ncbi:HXXEE domain-containing protein [Cryptosporangium minutisporangium]|uniref:HXXEE domain-containing protein n=1 Tax=Cryptosporangium minutisporangium TaxID=113569 RepID=A0ABP6STQ2_9ACTN
MTSSVTPWATWGLFAAWLVHDVEEAATMSRWAQRARPELAARFPAVPERAWRVLDVTPAQAGIAIGSVGVVMAAAAADGARTGGRSGFYQAALVGFGLHALSHLGASAAARGYTPGVVTTPLVVAPFSIWAWRKLGAAGVPRKGGPSTWWAVAALPLTVGGGHALARWVTRRR